MTISISSTLVGDNFAFETMGIIVCDKARWAVLDTKIIDNNNSNETILVSIDGDPAYQATKRIGVYHSPPTLRDPLGKTNYSIKTTGYAVSTDDVTGEVLVYPRSTVIAGTSEYRGPLDVRCIESDISLLVSRDETPALHTADRIASPFAVLLGSGISAFNIADFVAVPTS
jgi:hypothetical protein